MRKKWKIIHGDRRLIKEGNSCNNQEPYNEIIATMLYEHYISVCDELGIHDARLQVDKMIVCDYIIANFDRHYRNFGLLRNIG